MKKTAILLFLFTAFLTTINAQGVSISADDQEPHPSGILDLISTEKGFLVPRMTTEQRDAIDEPAESLIIFNTDNKCFETYVFDYWQSIWCPCVQATAPTGISGETEICLGDNTNLSVLGGSLGDEATWEWYTVSCGGVPAGSGANIDVSPTENTTYYVRAEGDCNITDCAEVEIVIEYAPDTPTAGTHIPDEEQIEWNWNPVADATGYAYNTTDDYSTATDNFTNTSYTQPELNCETEYTLFVWAYNDCGESVFIELTQLTSSCTYGCDEAIAPTLDEHTYKIVGIGNQCWFGENLKTTKYKDGSDIPNITDNGTWAGLSTGAYCWYVNNEANKDIYGALYNWFAVETGNLCPEGWRVPTDEDWYIMENYVDPTIDDPAEETWRGTDIGINLKATSGWDDDGNGIDYYGFTAVPGGYRNDDTGLFYALGSFSYWWTSSGYNVSSSWYRSFRNYNEYSNRYYYNKRVGAAVRCVKE